MLANDFAAKNYDGTIITLHSVYVNRAINTVDPVGSLIDIEIIGYVRVCYVSRTLKYC